MTFINKLIKRRRNLFKRIEYSNLLKKQGNMFRARPDDSIPPVFVSWSDGLGDSIEVEFQSSYVLPSANFTDDKRGDFVVTLNKTINTDVQPDTVYELEYVGRDFAGNKTIKTKTLTIKDNSFASFVRWTDGLGDSVDVEINSAYTLPNAVFSENGVEQTVTPTAGYTFDTSQYGQAYVVRYTAYDNNNNMTVRDRTYNIVDTTAPVIFYNGNLAPSTVNIDVEYGIGSEVDVTFTDNSNEATMIKSDVFSNTVNKSITYTVIDVGGNQSTLTIHYNVIDTTPPTFVSYNDNDGSGDTVYVEINSSYTLPTATFTDLKKGVFIVNAAGTLDLSTLATYTITYTGEDLDGNTFTKYRTYIVRDTTAPVITFSDNWVSGVTEIFTGDLPTVIVSDNSGEVISPSIIYDSQFDVDINGLYTYNYTATDSSGNVTTVTRQYRTYGPPTFNLSTSWINQATSGPVVYALNITITDVLLQSGNYYYLTIRTKENGAGTFVTEYNYGLINTDTESYYNYSKNNVNQNNLNYTVEVSITSQSTGKNRVITLYDVAPDIPDSPIFSATFDGVSYDQTEDWTFNIESGVDSQATITTSNSNTVSYRIYTELDNEIAIFTLLSNYPGYLIPGFDNTQNSKYIYRINSGYPHYTNEYKTITYNVFDSIVIQVLFNGQVIIDNTPENPIDVIQNTDNEPTFTVTNGTYVSQSSPFTNDILGAKSIIYNFTHDTVLSHTKQITIHYNVIAQEDTTPPVITATYNGVEVYDGDTLTVEKYTGVEANVVSDEGYLEQDLSFSNTISQTVTYYSHDGSNTTYFTLNYNVVDTTAPTLNYNKSTTDKTMTLNITDISEPDCEIYLYKDTTQIDYVLLTTANIHTFTVTESTYGTKNYKVKIIDGSSNFNEYSFAQTFIDTITPTASVTHATSYDATVGNHKIQISVTSISEDNTTVEIHKLVDGSYVIQSTNTLTTDRQWTISLNALFDDGAAIPLTESYKVIVKDPADNASEYTFDATFEYVGLTDINTSFNGLTLTISGVGTGAYDHYHWSIESIDYMSSSALTHTVGAFNNDYTVTAYAVNNSHSRIGNTISTIATSPPPMPTITGVYDDGSLFLITHTNTSYDTYTARITFTGIVNTTPTTQDFTLSTTLNQTHLATQLAVNDTYSVSAYIIGYESMFYTTIDLTAPNITFSDSWTAGNTEITIGVAYTFPTVSVTDENGENITAVFDHSIVDVNTAGSYDVTYTATDSVGNTKTVTRTYVVVEASTGPPTQQTLSSTGGSWGVRTYDVIQHDTANSTYVYSYSSSLPQHNFGYKYDTDTWVDAGSGDPFSFVITINGNERIVEGWRSPDSEFNSVSGVADMIFTFTDPYYVAPPPPPEYTYDFVLQANTGNTLLDFQEVDFYDASDNVISYLNEDITDVYENALFRTNKGDINNDQFNDWFYWQNAGTFAVDTSLFKIKLSQKASKIIITYYASSEYHPVKIRHNGTVIGTTPDPTTLEKTKIILLESHGADVASAYRYIGFYGSTSVSSGTHTGPIISELAFVTSSGTFKSGTAYAIAPLAYTETRDSQYTGYSQLTGLFDDSTTYTPPVLQFESIGTGMYFYVDLGESNTNIVTSIIYTPATDLGSTYYFTSVKAYGTNTDPTSFSTIGDVSNWTIIDDSIADYVAP